MTTASTDSRKPWETTGHDRPAGLTIILLKRTFVIPWSQFLYAEGNGEEARLTFSTHDIVVKGAQLGSLMEDVSTQRLNLIRESVRAERFPSGAAPRISSISVLKSE